MATSGDIRWPPPGRNDGHQWGISWPRVGRNRWPLTVGYGDVTPRLREGRIIAAVIMLAGIAFLAVITASVTATLVESSRRRFAASAEVDVAQRLVEVNERLSRIETALRDAGSGDSPHGVS
jgi:Ion channel